MNGYIIGGVLLLIAGLGASTTIFYYRSELKATEAADAKKLSDSLQATLKYTQEKRDQAEAEIKNLQQVQVDRKINSDNTKKEIIYVPNSNSCVGSQPIHALINGVRSQQSPTTNNKIPSATSTK